MQRVTRSVYKMLIPVFSLKARCVTREPSVYKACMCTRVYAAGLIVRDDARAMPANGRQSTNKSIAVVIRG